MAKRTAPPHDSVIVSARIPTDWYRALRARCAQKAPPTRPATLLRWLIQQYLAKDGK